MRIFLIVLSLCFTLASCSTKTPPVSLSEGSSMSTQWVSYVQALEKTSSKIKNTKEFEECMQPSVNMCVSQVGNQLARTQKSTIFCDEMAEGEGRDGCKYGVIMLQVSEMKDIAQCDSLSARYKKECRISILLQTAVSSNDIKKCDLIDSESSSESGSIERSGDRAEQCRADLIMRKQDAKIIDCDILKNGTSKDMCKAIVKNRTEWGRTLSELPIQGNPN